MATFKAGADTFVRNIMHGNLGGEAEEWSLDEALGCMEAFHVLEALPRKWSPLHLFKCNCTEFFKNTSCVHSVLTSMVCDLRIKIPSRYIGITIQQRRRRGRPGVKGSEVGDMEEAKASARIELQKQYKLQKVSGSICMGNM